MSRMKIKLYRKYLSNPSPLALNDYKKVRNKYVNSLRSARRMYYLDKIKSSSNDIKGTWKIINDLLQKNISSKNVMPLAFVDDGKIYENSIDIAHNFNTFFVNSGPELVEKMSIAMGDPMEYITSNYPQIISFHPPDIQELSKIIDELKLSSSGHDDLSAWLVKQIKQFVLQPLAYIISLSLSTGVIPEDLKVAKVIPLFKAGERQCFNNYRPISILPCFSKVMEKVVYKRIICHINNNSILYKHQYGFRKNHSTYMAVLHLIDNIISTLDSNIFVCSIFLDLSKAFDTVNHNILLAKLQKYGFHGIVFKWLQNYITKRSQFVSINGCHSNKMDIHCGVPQGSILGPLLFLIYVNDLCTVSHALFPIMFADDTTLVTSHSNPNALMKQANEGLSAYNEWFKRNKLALNINKSNFMIFSGKKTFSTSLTINIASVEISRVASTRFLGVIIDEHLNWKEHVRWVMSKVNKSIGIIRKVSHSVGLKCTLALYYSLIYPYLSYCNIVWASTFPSTLNQILILQKRFVRFATHSEPLSSSANLFLKLNLLNIYDINVFQICIFMFKIQFNQTTLPDHFISYFTTNAMIHNYNTRQNKHFHLFKCVTSRAQFCIRYRGCKLWNQFSYVVNSKSERSFKKYLRKSIIMSHC